MPSCAEGGVLGILPGVVGTLQATEAIKTILGKGEPLIGRLLLIDALNMNFKELKVQKNPNCPICSPNATIKSLIDYEAFCGTAHAERLNEENEITVRELSDRMGRGRVNLIDVREPHECEICKIDGSRNIPLGDIPSRVSEFNQTDEYVFQCHSGIRSARAVSFLRELGFRRVKNLVGGIDAWSVEIDPSIPRY